MAASTLHTLLFKLGFEISGLQSGGRMARAELESLSAAAGKVAVSALPATAALERLVQAQARVANTPGATTALNNLAGSIKAIDAATSGSVPAMNAFAKAALAIANSTGSGSALNAFARAATSVAVATGNPAALRAFAAAATEVAAVDPARFVSFVNTMRQSVDPANQGAAALSSLGDAGNRAASGLAAAGAAAGTAIGATSAVAGGAGAAAGQLNAAGASAAGATDGLLRLGAAEDLAANGAAALIEGLSGASGVVQNTDTSADGLIKELDALSARLGETAGRIDQLMTSFGASEGPVTSFNMGLGGVNDLLFATGDLLRDVSKQLEDFAREARQAVDFNVDLSASFAAITPQVDVLTAHIQELLDYLRQVRNEFENPPGGFEGGEGGGGGNVPRKPQGPPPVGPQDLDAAINEAERLIEETKQIQQNLGRMSGDAKDAGDQASDAFNRTAEAARRALQQLDLIESQLARTNNLGPLKAQINSIRDALEDLRIPGEAVVPYSELQRQVDILMDVNRGYLTAAEAAAKLAGASALDQARALDAVRGKLTDYGEMMDSFTGLTSEASIQARALMSQLYQLNAFGKEPIDSSFYNSIMGDLERIARAGKATKGELTELTNIVQNLTATSAGGPGSLMPKNYSLTGEPNPASWAKITDEVEQTKAKAQQLLDVIAGLDDATSNIKLGPEVLDQRVVTELNAIVATGREAGISLKQLGAMIDIAGEKAQILAVEAQNAAGALTSASKPDVAGTAALRAELERIGLAFVEAKGGAQAYIESLTISGKAAAEEELAFTAASDALGEQADRMYASLGKMRAAGQLTAEQFDLLMTAVRPWVEVQMGGGFAVPSGIVSAEQLRPLYDLLPILEQIVTTGNADAESLAKVNAVIDQQEAQWRQIMEVYSEVRAAGGTLEDGVDAVTAAIQQMVKAGATVQLPSFEESAQAARDLAAAVEAVGGKAAYVDQLVARVQKLTGATTEATDLLHDMEDAMASQKLDPSIDAQLVAMVAGLTELEARAKAGVIDMEAMDAAFAQAGNAAERFEATAARGLGLSPLGDITDIQSATDAVLFAERALGGVERVSEETRQKLDDMVQSLYDFSPASRQAAMAMSELMMKIEQLAFPDTGVRWVQGGAVDWLVEHGVDIDNAEAAVNELMASLANGDWKPNVEAIPAALEKLMASAKDGKIGVDALRQALATIEGPAKAASDAAQIIKPGSASVEGVTYFSESLRVLAGDLQAMKPASDQAKADIQSLLNAIKELQAGTANKPGMTFYDDAVRLHGVSEAVNVLREAMSRGQVTAKDTAEAVRVFETSVYEAEAVLTSAASPVSKLVGFLEQLAAQGRISATTLSNLKVVLVDAFAPTHGPTGGFSQSDFQNQALYEVAEELDEITSASGAASEAAKAWSDDFGEGVANALTGAGDFIDSNAQMITSLERTAQAAVEAGEALKQVSEPGPVMPTVSDKALNAARKMQDELGLTANQANVLADGFANMGAEIAASLGPKNQENAASISETLDGLVGQTKEAQAALDLLRTTLQRLGEIRGGGAIKAAGDLEQLEDQIKRTTLWEMGPTEAVPMETLSHINALVQQINKEDAEWAASNVEVKATVEGILASMEQLAATGQMTVGDFGRLKEAILTGLNPAQIEYMSKAIFDVAEGTSTAAEVIRGLGPDIYAAIEATQGFSGASKEVLANWEAIDAQAQALITTLNQLAMASSNKGTPEVSLGLWEMKDRVQGLMAGLAAGSTGLAQGKVQLDAYAAATDMLAKRAENAALTERDLAEASAALASSLEAEGTAAEANGKKLYGAAKAAHEAAVARREAAAAANMATSAGAGGAGGGVPPTATGGPAGAGGGGDEFKRQYQNIANLLGQLEAVKASANTAGAALKGAGAAAGGAGSGFGSIPPKADAAAASMNRVAKSADMAANRGSFLNRTLSMAFAFSGGVMVTNVIAFITNALGGFNSRLEQTRIALSTMLGSTDKAEKFLNDMLAFANVTPFTFDTLKTAVQRMLAMGFTAEQVLPSLRAMGDAVAALGGTTEMLDRVSLAIGQIATAGRVNAQDMRQLTEAGIPAWDILAKSIGKSVEETRKLATNGLIPANQAVAALLGGMEERFSGMMARQARTAMGAFSTIHDVMLETISNAVKPFYDAISSGMVAFADYMISGGGKMIAPMIYAIGTAIAVALIPRMYGAAIAAATVDATLFGLQVRLLPLIIAVTLLATVWQENFGGMRDALEPLIKAVGSVFGEIAKYATILVPLITAVIVAISVKFVGGLIASAFWVAVLTAENIALSGSLINVGLAAGGAAGGMGAFATASGAAVAIVGGLVGVIAIVVAAFALLVMNFDTVVQGLRVVYYNFLQLEKGMADFLTSIPGVGQGFTWLKDHVASEMADVVKEMDKAQKDIDAKAKAAAASAGETDLDKLLASLKLKIQEETSNVTVATQSLVDKFGATLSGVIEAAKTAGGAAMDEMAKAITAKINAPIEALKNLRTVMQSALSDSARMARDYGVLASEELAAGLADPRAEVRAAAEATRKYFTEDLDLITGGAYSAGQAYTKALADGTLDSSALTYLRDNLERLRREEQMGAPAGSTTAGLDMLIQVADAVGPVINSVVTSLNSMTPSAEEVAAAVAKMNEELASVNSEAASALSSAFSEIASAANQFFSEQHSHNLQLIDDALKQKNAILDAKEALNMGPVDAAQKALDAQRKAIEEWRLREAVRTASSPEAYRDAVLALRDFLAQKHIDEMRAEAENANAVIDARKKANEDAAAAAKAAEDARYGQMQRDFERQLELLRRYLEKHPGEWQNTQEKIRALLYSYGFDYNEAGKYLGQSFVDGLDEKVAAAQQAVGRLAGLSNEAQALIAAAVAAAAAGAELVAQLNAGGLGANVSVGSGGAGNPGAGGRNGAVPLASGLWDTLNKNIYAVLHPRELVAPENTANLIRAFGSSPLSFGAQGALGSNGGGTGATFIFQIGEEKFGEITDRALYRQAAAYGSRQAIRVGGSLR